MKMPINSRDNLHKAALWAGSLGVAQSVIWIALTSIGILAYNCFFNLPSSINFGTIVRYVFFYLYFKGDCEPEIYQQFNFTILGTVDRILDPTQILIWSSVYLGVSVCWLIVSVLLFIYLRKDDVSMLAIRSIYAWAAVTFLICCMDLAQGIIFGIDYGNFYQKSHEFNLDAGQPNDIDPNSVLLIAGQISAITMMIISLKGFILWVVNIGLVIYLLRQVCLAMEDKDENDILFMSRSNESDDIPTTYPPINAFETSANQMNTGCKNEGFTIDNHSIGTLELNHEAIARAARMSMHSSLQDHRFRNLESFQQYPPPRTNNSRGEDSNKELDTSPTSMSTTFPAPDYSPLMIRLNQSTQNGLLRNQRY